jgi:TIR domain
MVKPSSAESELNEKNPLESEVLFVTEGPFAGRVCLDVDDDFIARNDLNNCDLEWLSDYEVSWERLCHDDDFDPEIDIGVHCQIVKFGTNMDCRGTFAIPRQFLRVATTDDLLVRFEKINSDVHRSVWSEDFNMATDEVVDVLKERSLVFGEVWNRDGVARKTRTPRTVFLCHSSTDKVFVKRLWSDLARVGYKPWLDEFEIDVGHSIVDKINEGTKRASALVLVLSKKSIESNWVKREWNSTLSRQLANGSVAVLPVLTEDCEIPPLLSDIKFADFRNDYLVGLHELTSALEKLKPSKRPAKRN